MRLETERLILRRPEARDVEDYLKLHNSEFVLRFNAMTPKSREEILAQFTTERQEWDALVMELKDTGRIIGAVFTEEDSLRWGVTSKELSYFLGEDYSQQGYMREALGALIGYLFETENMECVSARVFAPNTASRRLLISLGFHQDGLIPRCVRGYGGVIFDDCLYSRFRN